MPPGSASTQTNAGMPSVSTSVRTNSRADSEGKPSPLMTMQRERSHHRALCELKGHGMFFDNEDEGCVRAEDLDIVREARDRVSGRPHLRQVDDLRSVANDESTIDRSSARLDEAECLATNLEQVRQGGDGVVAIRLMPASSRQLGAMVVVKPALRDANPVAKIGGRGLERGVAAA